MSRFHRSLALAVLFAAACLPHAASAMPSPVPSPAPTDTAPNNKDAGTIDGTVTEVDVAPGKSKMVVKSGAQSYTFAILAGTSVKGPSGDFAVDVKVGAHVSVSASKSGNAYTAQIVRVVAVTATHGAH